MERAFNTHFEFHGKTYTTFVREYSDPSDFSLQIEVPDESLLYLLPNGKIVYSSRTGLQAETEKDNVLARELIGCIVRSVEQHLV